MTIVDAQLHEPSIHLDWSDADPVIRHRLLSEVELATMDAVGVDAALLFPKDLAWAEGLADQMPDRFAVAPAFAPGGGLKGWSPEGAPLLDPLAEGFDEDFDRQWAKSTCVAFRIMDPRTRTGRAAELSLLETYDPALSRCEDLGIPVFMSTAGRLGAPVELARHYPKLTIVIDHLGIPQPPTFARESPVFRILPELLELAAEPNLALKWSGVPTLSEEPYPFQDLWPSLRRIIDAFGADRLMWGSDISRIAGKIGFDLHPGGSEPYDGQHQYAQALHYLKDSDQLSATEKEWLLGRTAQMLLRWPVLDQDTAPEFDGASTP